MASFRSPLPTISPTSPGMAGAPSCLTISMSATDGISCIGAEEQSMAMPAPSDSVLVEAFALKEPFDAMPHAWKESVSVYDSGPQRKRRQAKLQRRFRERGYCRAVSG